MIIFTYRPNNNILLLKLNILKEKVKMLKSNV